MTALSHEANWYADPSGRHEGRFWDGFAWTAHVFDAGVPGVDPPVAVLPALAPSTTSEVASTLPALTTLPVTGPEALSNAGHGTRQLQAMATQAAHARRASAAHDATSTEFARADRKTLFGMSIPSVVGLAVLAVVAVVGISATGILQPGSGSTPAIATMTPISGDGYTAAVPLGWANATAPPEGPFDSAYSVPGLEPVAVGVGAAGLTEAQVADPKTRAATLDFVAQTIAGTFGQVVRVASRDTRVIAGRSIDVITVEVTYPEGGTGHVAEYLVVGTDRSVVIAASGSQIAVTERQSQLSETARSVRFPKAT